jgi:hypothetical protein
MSSFTSQAVQLARNACDSGDQVLSPDTHFPNVTPLLAKWYPCPPWRLHMQSCTPHLIISWHPQQHYGLQRMLRVGLDLLTAVAEEAETHLGGKPRQDACSMLTDQADDVLSTLGVALAKALSAAGACTHTGFHSACSLGAALQIHVVGVCTAAKQLDVMSSAFASYPCVGMQVARRRPCQQ